MKQILLTVIDEHKSKYLLDFLRQLHFVEVRDVVEGPVESLRVATEDNGLEDLILSAPLPRDDGLEDIEQMGY